MIKKYADWALLLCAMLWGFGYVASAIVLDGGITPFQMLAFRFTIAGVVLGVIFWKKMKKLTWAAAKAGALLGFFIFVSYAFQNIGLLYTTPSKNAFLTATFVIIVPFVNWIITKIRPDGYSFIGALLCMVGAALLSLTDGLTNVNIGDILTIIGALFLSFQFLAVSKYVKKFDIMQLTTLQLVVAGILGVISAAIEGAPIQVADNTTFWALLYLTFVSSLLTFLLQNLSQQYVSATKMSIIFSTEAVFGTGFSALVLSEHISGQMLIGSVFIFIAVILVETKLAFLKRPGRL